MKPPPWKDELQALCEAAVEQRLTAEQVQRLEQLVLDNAEARRFYVEYLHQHASLHWSAAGGAGADATPVPQRRTRSRLVRWAAGLATAAALLMGVWLLWRPTPAAVATLADAKACKWDGGSLPTEIGARLGAGRLRLGEGLVRLVFNSGAEVTLEGPADLELVSARHCILHAGRLVARVPPPAMGFIVDTPTAVLKDLGTEFGVHVREAGEADVQVFNGLVDARHRASGKLERMRTGKNLRFGTAGVAEFDPLAEQSVLQQPAVPGGEGRQVVHLSTAMGRGKDAYVQPLFPSKNSSTVLSLVKNAAPDKSDWVRKAYVGLDLAPVAGRHIVEAQLSFTFAPTGLGFASEVPDATFVVYGLTDESLDDWDERTLRWPNAPANQPGGADLDPAKVVRLGTFQIAQGVQSGTHGIAGPALTDFLNKDTNGLVTFLVVRETLGSGRNDLVHGFANKHHPTLPPPALKLTVGPR